MDSGFRRNEGEGVTGVGWRNAIQIPAFAGMTALGAGMTGGRHRRGRGVSRWVPAFAGMRGGRDGGWLA